MTPREHLAAIRTELDAIQAAHPDFNFPPEVEQRMAVLQKEADGARASKELADRARGATGRPLSSAAQPEFRVFDNGLSPRPEGFDGRVLVSQSGELVPLIEHRHRLSAFLPAEQRSEIGIGQFVRAWLHGPRSEIERRVLAESAIGTGQALVPTPLSATIIDALIPLSVALRAGASMVPMASQTQKFARVTAIPVMAFRAENAAIAEDQPAFDAVTLTAHTAAVVVRCSRELLEDGTNTSATIQQVIGQAGALCLDTNVLHGTGAANNPLGIVGNTGIQSIAGGGAFAGWTKVLDAVAALEGANAGAVTAIVYAPRTGRVIAGLQDTTNQPLMLPPKLAGIPQFSTTSMPINEGEGTNESSIILGDFGTVMVGMRTQLQVQTLTERFRELGQVGFVAWLRMDVALQHPAAMAKITGITP